MKQLTFEEVCKQLKENKDYGEMLAGLNALSGATILLLGVRSASGDISAFLNALVIKDELIKIGKCILDKIIKEKNNECDKRVDQMQWAYSMIYYTAFFDVLDEQMPEQMRKEIGLSLEEKKGIFQNIGIEKREGADSLINTQIFFPNIVHGYAYIEEHLVKLYKSMCEGLMKFVHMLSFEENSSEQAILEFHNIVDKLPELAMKRFKGQYLYLAGNFNEFYVYMHIEEEKEKAMHIDELYKNIISVSCDTNNKIDVGLGYLENILLDLPEIIQEEKVNNIIDALIENYNREIDKPIIDSKSSNEKLQYPSINKAFIPQSYKLLEYTGIEKLEKKDTWVDQEEHKDMDSFWAKYCVSHYSLENLLLILGEPGGGKSLLTKIICARMSDRNNIFVRIPLREVSVEKEIEDIVCEQIQKDGDAEEPLPTYKWFAGNFKYNPITLVFDGYDEVLQATGGVYRNLLKKIQKFQEQCAEKHRPVRIIVTSRETLIDKADIPTGTVVLKLLEFDEEQREEWIKIWNHNNDEIFKKEHIKPFDLPEYNGSIDELSRQPLLLLMLAIYDANLEEGINSLSQEENLNRTKLYNELLRRFIRRELRKGPRGNEVPYEEAEENEKEKMIDLEMEKLGIAALGMFIRGKLSLNVSEMERDLSYMESRTPVYKNIGKMLSNAEELFGSFFFIHDSQSGNIETEDKEVAFEFLHKTFYEFLVADLVLRYLIGAIDELDALKNSKRSDSYQRALDDPNHFEKQYYTALMNAYLCAEPEIIEMIVEWKENKINDCFQGKRLDYDNIIEELFNRQIEMLCNTIFMPQIWNEQSNDNVVKKSYLQYCATYFMNLLILQATTKNDSKRIVEDDDWRYISQFWKMNIQEDILLKFTSLFDITNAEGGVCIEKKQVLSIDEQKNLLERQMDIFNFLQDDISYNLYSLHDEGVQHSEKQKCRKILLEKKIDMKFEILLGEIYEYILGNHVQFSVVDNIIKGIDILSKKRIDTSLVLDWLICINTCLDKTPSAIFRNKGAGSELVNIIMHMYTGNIQLVFEALKCCRKLRGEVIVRDNSYVHRNIEKMIYENPQLSLEYFELLEHIMPMEKMEVIIRNLGMRFCEISFQSPELIAGVFRIFYMYNVEHELNVLLTYIARNADEIYSRSPKAMVNILRLCVLQGGTKDVDDLVRKGFDNLDELFYEEPGLVVEFLEVIHMTGEMQQKVHYLVHSIDNRFKSIIYRNPIYAAKILKILSPNGNLYKYDELIHMLYQGYTILFVRDPKEAIASLKITKNVIEERHLSNALQYSLKRFNYLVVKSPESCADLLILCEELDFDICRYIEMYFNYILYADSCIDTIKVFELLDSLKNSDLNKMGDFFRERYLYIITNFRALAEKIAEVYHKSIGDGTFLNLLS